MSFDSISEKVRQRITTTPMALVMPTKLPPIKIMGAKVAMVVKTPMVDGVATRFTPLATVSADAV